MMIINKLYILEGVIATRYLLSKKNNQFISLITILSFLGIILGVSALIVVMSVMNGYRHDLINLTLGLDGHVTIYARQGQINNGKLLTNDLSQNTHVNYALPIIERNVVISKNHHSTGALVQGMDLEDINKKPMIRDNILGNIQDFKDNGILLGQRLASSLGIRIGDEVQIIAPELVSTIIGSLPKFKYYKVVGVFSTGMALFDSVTILLPTQSAEKLFNMKGKSTQIEIFVTNPENIESIKASLFTQFQYLNQYRVLDWKQAKGSLISALEIERVVMKFILSIIIIVATFNIIAGMVMLVIDKEKNIAILRTIGMTKVNIMRIFFLCGTIVGVLGTIFGTILGIVIASNIENIRLILEDWLGFSLFNPIIYHLSHLPSVINYTEVMQITIFSIIISCIATIYPAYRAAQYEPAIGVKNG